MIRLDNLKKIIDKDRGLKRKWVAENIGLTDGSFRLVLCGKNEISFKKAVELAKLLKVDLYEIWTEENGR
jgi:hypothetical protein